MQDSLADAYQAKKDVAGALVAVSGDPPTDVRELQNAKVRNEKRGHRGLLVTAYAKERKGSKPRIDKANA